ncbi:3'-5' exonuclease domain-containing protein 2 [Shewanella sp. Choline-02u-19]|uniref:3'-5' exonuclease n=1 Tax=unclassified Shewanella TaxID=196818 RepID=UPI000C32BF6B|nr:MULTISPECIES: 3'-5' exonuclease [unclassified Shewanella]PKH56707.1 3'-5' exonuclease domain-containing protein 2 [Shewanella sp. Bg11-22]PKI30258.1 3'-5' exonuclease domain-containing protein 2 [Shewanella sp. Choline-02u-19]
MSLYKFGLAADKSVLLRQALGAEADAYFAAMESAEQAFLSSITNEKNQQKLDWLLLRTNLICRMSDRDIARLSDYRIDKTQMVTENLNGKSRQIVIVTVEALAAVIDDIKAQQWVGFDTETAATFEKGRRNTNPISLIQIATSSHCYLFRMVGSNILPFKTALTEVLGEDSNIVKIGIGLRSDVNAVKRDFGIALNPILDLNWLMNQLGAAKQMGTVQIAATVLALKLPKSKRVTLSNWAIPLDKSLSAEQINYAAGDALAALDIFHALFEQLSAYKALWPKSIQQRF